MPATNHSPDHYSNFAPPLLARALMYAKHLPPSAGLPRVLALDAAAAAELAERAEIVPGALSRLPDGPFDAAAGEAGPFHLAALQARLRPGGRLILASAGTPEGLLAALVEAGLIHCLVEECDLGWLYRGERSPLGDPLARQQALAGQPTLPGAEIKTPHVFLLVNQTPNRPIWKPSGGEGLVWEAATVRDPATGQAALLAFSALVKAVAYMQRAILVGNGPRINKVGKFPAAAAAGWPLPYLLNPDFEALGAAPAGPSLRVEPQRAITGEES
ncbi:MAG: hypothetical protein IT317_15675 [Anaerolineales bacterium]|nr:hypothetical protein [Anaerolineales bacterium]